VIRSAPVSAPSQEALKLPAAPVKATIDPNNSSIQSSKRPSADVKKALNPIKMYTATNWQKLFALAQKP
jgi:hypothetical protein